MLSSEIDNDECSGKSNGQRKGNGDEQELVYAEWRMYLDDLPSVQ